MKVNIKRLIGMISLSGVGMLLLSLGVIVGSVTAAKLPPLMWGFYISVIIMVIGVFLMRFGKRKEVKEKGVQSLDELVDMLGENLENLKQLDKTEESASLCKKLGEINWNLSRFAEEASIIQFSYGTGKLGEIRMLFGKGERNLNRAWSALVDGSNEETTKCLEKAELDLKETLDRLKELKKS
jgi:hypothetical protein